MARNLQESRALQKRAEQLIPGGVNSPVRAFRAVGGEPPFLVRGEAPTYRTPTATLHRLRWLLGPADAWPCGPEVVEAIIHAARKGTSFGASTPSEIDLAEVVIEAFPSIEKLRFVSSGTEATMSAIRLARAATKRKIHHQVRRLLSRPHRRAAGEGRLRGGHAWHSRLGRRAGRIRPVHAGAALQRSQALSKRPSTSSRGRSPASLSSRSSATWAAFCRNRATWNFCARSPRAKARC